MIRVSFTRTATTLAGGALLVAALAPAVARAQYRQPDNAAAVVRIAVGEFKKLVDAGEVVVIDVRGPAEYAAGHVPGAINVPLEAVPGRASTWKDSTKPVVTYCA